MATPKRPKRPRDFNQLAHEVFLESIGEKEPIRPPIPSANTPTIEPTGAVPTASVEPTSAPRKNPHAVALSKLGAAKGGKARTAGMTPEERKELARKAARARWNRKPK
jgi:hypothetical protein